MDTRHAESSKAQARPIASGHGTRIYDQRPIPPCDHPVTLFVGGRPGGYEELSMRAARPVLYDDLVVVVREDDVSPITPLLGPNWFWPMTPRLVAREVRRDLRRARATLGPLEKAERGVLFDARWQDANNMAHLLLDILPLALHAQDVLGDEVTSVFYELGKIYRDVLDVVGLRYRTSTRRLGGALARVRATRGLASYDVAGAHDIPGITLVPGVYDRFRFEAPFRAEKIYVARRDGRRLANHDDVERFLTSRGYKTIYPEDYSAAEQLGIGQQCTHCVSIHGAGMASLIMSRSLANVVELLPAHNYHTYFPMCFGHKTERYVFILPEHDATLVHGGYDALEPFKSTPIRVDLGVLERAVSS